MPAELPSPFRTPPHDIEAEMRVLAAVMLNEKIMNDLPVDFGSDCFFRNAHVLIFDAIKANYSNGLGIEFYTIEDELRKQGNLDQAGGAAAIIDIINCDPLAANWRHYVEVVRSNYMLREALAVADRIYDKVYSKNDVYEDILDKAASEIVNLTVRGSKATVKDFRESLLAVRDVIDKRRSGEVEGISTGFPSLDKVIGGAAPGRFIIVAGRPGMGKTAFALGMALFQGINFSRVLFISREMSDVELAMRAISSSSKIDSRHIQEAVDLNHYQIKCIDNAIEYLSQAKIHVDDSSCETANQVEAIARKINTKYEGGLQAIYVDYIQLLEGEQGSRSNRQETVAKISRTLKRLAGALKVPVIALSQLNRAVESRESKRPMMSDLRESGAIEQDADQVLLLHRPSYYNPDDNPGMCEVIIGKNRHGAARTIELPFHAPTTTFSEFIQEHEYA